MTTYLYGFILAVMLPAGWLLPLAIGCFVLHFRIRRVLKELERGI